MRKRISLLAACGLAAVGLTAAPVHAAEPVFTLISSSSAIGLRPHPAGGGEAQKRWLQFRLDGTIRDVFEGPVTFTIDLSGLKGVVDVSLRQDGADPDCKQTATAVTCTKARLWSTMDLFAMLDISAAKDAKVGTTVDLTMTGKAAGAKFEAATTKVKVGGPDLVLEAAKLKREMTPGQTQNLPIVFSNGGTESVGTVVLEINATRGMGLVERYDNCSYTDPEHNSEPDLSRTVCTIEGELEPGAVYEADPLTLKAAPYAFNESMTYSVHEKAPEPKTAQKLVKPNTGKKLTARKRPAKAAQDSPEIDLTNNTQGFDFAVKNSADFVARGASLKGKAGDTVKADLGFRNDGPAWIWGVDHTGANVAVTDIVIPAGAKVTKMPKGCWGANADGSPREWDLGAPRYFCSTSTVVGEKQNFTYPFELKIETFIEDAKGSVMVGRWAHADIEVPAWDPNPANNKATFVINAKDTGPTPTPTPTATSTPTPGQSATPTAAPSAGNSPKPSGGLASTGSTVGPVAIGGAVLVAVGGALVVAFRRRAAGRA